MNRRQTNYAMWHYPLFGLTAIFLLTPTVIIIVMSFSAGSLLMFPPTSWGTRWYHEFVSNPLWSHAFWFSLRLGVSSAICVAVVGTGLAVGLASATGALARVVSAMVLAPLIVPILVIAIGMYFASTYITASTFWMLLLAHTALAMPFLVLVVTTQLRLIDPNLERAARGLGATPWRVFWRVTLPLITPSIAVGAIFAFQFSWDEVIVANFLSAPGQQTLPVVMWAEASQSIKPTIAAASSVLTAVTLLVLCCYLALQRRAFRRTLTAVTEKRGL